MKLTYLLDTNICIYIIKQNPISVLQRFQALSVGEIGMSTITYGELLYGAEKSQHPIKNRRILDEITSLIPTLPIPTKAGNYYGKIRQHLEKKGNLIGNNDLWIAAHCLALDLKLVTNNQKEFARVPHLSIENWVN